jgi:hypothetical protein
VRAETAVLSTARPTAPPTCWAVLNSPEVTPASSGFESAMPRVIKAGMVMPKPSVAVTIPGRTSTR